MQLVLGGGSEEAVCRTFGTKEWRADRELAVTGLFATGTKRVRQFHCPIRATTARGLKLSDESRHSPHSERYNRRALNLGELWQPRPEKNSQRVAISKRR